LKTEVYNQCQAKKYDIMRRRNIPIPGISQTRRADNMAVFPANLAGLSTETLFFLKKFIVFIEYNLSLI
jgi:hypothetical protein